MLAIVLALGASLCWGSGDFLGGLTARRASLWAVIVGSQAVGLVGAMLVVVLAGHDWPGLQAVWPVLLGGFASVVAISCFYKALAIGSMSIFALATTQGYLSLVAVLGSVYPVVTVLLAYGLLRERIAPHQMVGAAGTLAGIALIAAG